MGKPYTVCMTPRSPFARRIRYALTRLGIPFDEEEINVFEPKKEFLELTPLGLVPVLKSQHGTILDSSTILEYLHELHGGIWPLDPDARARIRSAAALATGGMLAVVQRFLETRRKNPDPEWLKEHEDIIQDVLKRTEQEVMAPKSVWILGDTPSQAGYDLAVLLEYLDIRFPELKWRESHPMLTSFLARVRQDPKFCLSTPLQN